VSPAKAQELGLGIDAWLSAHEMDVKALRAKWLGAASDWTCVEHLVDLLARRLALMPAVAAYKRAHGLPIEDLPREAIVLQSAIDAAEQRGLDGASVRGLFVAQIELAKAIQARAPATTGDVIDLASALRPTLDVLSERILSALAGCADALPRLSLDQLDLIAPSLLPDERDGLLEALRAVRRASD
jgi:chorismate mutase-like protein